MKHWINLIKDGYFIRQVKYKCGTINYQFVKGETQTGQTLLYYLSYEVVKKLKKIGAHVRKDLKESNALNFSPKENVPKKGEYIYFIKSN